MIDARIPLGIRQPDTANALLRGTQAAGTANSVIRDNRLAQTYAQHGAGILSGDMNALNALAGVDPRGALQARQAHQQMQHAEERLRLARAAGARAAANVKSREEAQRLATEAAESNRIVAMAMADPENADRYFANSPLTQEYIGQDPAVVYAGIQGFQGNLQDVWEMTQQPENDNFRIATPEEAAAYGADAGQFGPDNRFYPIKDGQTINVNSIPNAPTGYENVFDNGQFVGQQVIPGGPADYQRQRDEARAAAEASAAAAETAATNRKAGERARQTSIKMGTTLENLSLNIGEIEDGGVPVTGFIGAAGSWVPGTPQRDFYTRNQQITTRAALDEVQNMRDNSPTGGAVGQLTDGEREAIGLAATAMDQATSPQEYTRAAKRYRQVMLDTAYGEGNWKIDERTGTVLVTPPDGTAPGTVNRLRYNIETGEFE